MRHTWKSLPAKFKGSVLFLGTGSVCLASTLPGLPLNAMIFCGSVAGLLALLSGLTIVWRLPPRPVANLMIGLIVCAIAISLLQTSGGALASMTAVPVVLMLAALAVTGKELYGWAVILISMVLAAWIVRPEHAEVAVSGWVVSVQPFILTIAAVVLALVYRETASRRRLAARREFDRSCAEWQMADLENARLRDFAELATDVMWETDSQMRFTAMSKGFESIAGVAADQCIGLTPKQVYEKFSDYEEIFEAENDATNAQQSFTGQRLPWSCNGDQRIFLNSGIARFDDAGGFQGYRGVLRDVTEVEALRRRLQREARMDVLTGLLNRRAIVHDLDEALRSSLASQTAVALMYMDLDRFKQVNDAAGHEAGDAMLIMVADCLAETLPEGAVGRIGGDEFVWFATGVDLGVARQWADEVVQRIHGIRMVREGNALRVGVSVGLIVDVPESDSDYESWLSRVDEAAYCAKRRGRGQVAVGE